MIDTIEKFFNNNSCKRKVFLKDKIDFTNNILFDNLKDCDIHKFNQNSFVEEKEFQIVNNFNRGVYDDINFVPILKFYYNSLKVLNIFDFKESLINKDLVEAHSEKLNIPYINILKWQYDKYLLLKKLDLDITSVYFIPMKSSNIEPMVVVEVDNHTYLIWKEDNSFVILNNKWSFLESKVFAQDYTYADNIKNIKDLKRLYSYTNKFNRYYSLLKKYSNVNSNDFCININNSLNNDHLKKVKIIHKDTQLYFYASLTNLINLNNIGDYACVGYLYGQDLTFKNHNINLIFKNGRIYYEHSSPVYASKFTKTLLIKDVDHKIHSIKDKLFETDSLKEIKKRFTPTAYNLLEKYLKKLKFFDKLTYNCFDLTYSLTNTNNTLIAHTPDKYITFVIRPTIPNDDLSLDVTIMDNAHKREIFDKELIKQLLMK